MVASSLTVAGATHRRALSRMPDIFQSARDSSGIYDAFFFTQGGLGYAPVSIFLFAAAHSMRRHDRAPLWLAWLGYLAALGAGDRDALDLLQRPVHGTGSARSRTLRRDTRRRSG